MQLLQMLGRSARERRPTGTPTYRCPSGAPPTDRATGHSRHTPKRKKAKKTSNSRSRRRPPGLPSYRGGSPQQARIAIAERNAAEGAEQWFLLQLPVHRGSFEPCGPQPWPAEARKHPAVARRAPQAAPAPPRQPYFVILSVSEGSIWGKVTDSSSIFRSPQNDNAVFALNHFLSGIHFCVRPGRLRGSHL